MQATGVLLQRSFPRHRHRQQQSVERRVIEAFPYQASCGYHDAGCVWWKGLEGSQGCAALALAQAAMQNEHVWDKGLKCCGDRADVIGAFAEEQHVAAFLPCSQSLGHDPVGALLILHQLTHQLLNRQVAG